MALDARSRSSIYRKLVPTLGEHDANVLMSEFPSVEADELVTRQFLRAEMAELRSEFRDLRGEVRAEVAGIRTELAELESRIGERFREMTIWVAGALIAGMGASAGVAAGIASIVG